MATATDFPVKFMHAGMPRAPALTQQPGSFVALLDAFLVTGWGAITAQRVTVEDGVATVQCNAGDTFEPCVVIDVAGAEDAALNGQARVLSNDGTKFTFATAASDGIKTGVIAIKAASAGWEKVFSAENRAVYRNTAPDAPQHYWYIDNTEGWRATIRGFASMDSIDNGQMPFPVAGTNAFIFCVWQQATSRQGYFLAADASACVCAPQASINSFANMDNEGCVPFFFGALAPFAGDSGQDACSAAICALCAWLDDARGWGGAIYSRSRAGSYMAGTVNGYSESNCAVLFYSAVKDNRTNVGADGSPLLMPSFCADGDGLARGIVPGIFACSHDDAPTHIGAWELFESSSAIGERNFIAVPASSCKEPVWANESTGRFFVDITGPWR